MATVPGGTKLGRYEVVKPLASGGMAELLLARTAPDERPLVLKWVRPEDAVDGPFVEAFVEEGRRAAQLHHPNIVEVHEVGRADGTHYLAMEYVHGDDVRKLLARLHERRAKLPVQHLIAITSAVAAAVHHAHEHRDAEGKPAVVLHLDLKPSNIIITPDGTVKVADFGIARAAFTEARTEQLGAFVGYMSPEQVTGQPVDRRSDVFGIGVLMYELATGRRLFKGENDFITMATVAAGDIVAPSRHRGDLPRDLEVIILRALSRAPEDRFQSVLELQTALDKFATKAGVRGSLTTLSGYTKRLFGVRPEPWLVEDETELSTPADFDGTGKGLATPPIEAVQACRLPDFVAALPSSPILRVRRQVSRDLPTEQLNLANLPRPGADKSAGVRIPAQAQVPVAIAPAASGRTKLPVRSIAPLPAESRPRPRTVQIPVVTADKIVQEESTAVLDPARAFASNEDTVENARTPAYASRAPARSEARTPTTETEPTRPNIPMQASVPRPVAGSPSASNGSRAPHANGTNGASGKPRQLGLADTLVAPSLRPALKVPPPKREQDPITTPLAPVVTSSKGAAGRAPADRSPTDVDETTAVANPPPMPIVSVSAAREPTAIVTPLPAPAEVTATGPIAIGTRGRKWLLAGIAGVVVLAGVIFAIGFSGDASPATAEPRPANTEHDEQVANPAADEPLPEPAAGLRSPAAGPRTPRNSFATTAPPPADPATPPIEPTPTAPAPSEPAIAPPPDEPPPIAAKDPEPAEVIDEPPPPPKFVEPRDPAPPDEPAPVTKKPKAKTTAKVATKPTKPTAKATPKPKAIARSNAKTAAAKPKPKTKPRTPKPKWDPNALFPK